MIYKLTQAQIDEILDLHQKWLDRDPAGKRANFSYMDLSGVDFSDRNLTRSNLSNANLECANLTGANMNGANLKFANLIGANFTGANLTSTNLKRANLISANLYCAILFEANLECANLTGANLNGANLKFANLTDANITGANLESIKEDFFTRLALAKNEVAGLYDYLLRGKIDGSCYEGECACFVGTIANIRHENYKNISNGLKPDSNSATEKFFLAIRAGDTPQNNPVAKIIAEWINEFMTQNNIVVN